MRRPRNVPEIVLGALLASAFFAIVLLVLSPWLPTAMNGLGSPKSFWKKTTEDPVAFFTLWLTLFSGISVVSNVGLWLVTGWTLRHSQDTAERQLRAYVFVEGNRDQLPIVDAGRRTTSPLAVINRGQTPAYKLTRWTNLEILPYPLVVPLQGCPPNQTKIPVDLGPNNPLTIHAVRDGAWTQQQIHGALSGKMRIYIYGEINYVDGFRKPQFTRFRLMAQVLPDGSLPGLEACEEGNEAS
jgi:hypothetical protein